MLRSSLCRSPTPTPNLLSSTLKDPTHHVMLSLCRSLHPTSNSLPLTHKDPTHHVMSISIHVCRSPTPSQIHSHPHSKTPLTMLCYIYAAVPTPALNPLPSTLKDPTHHVILISIDAESPHPIPIPLPPTVKGFLDNSPLGTIPHQIKLKPTY